LEESHEDLFLEVIPKKDFHENIFAQKVAKIFRASLGKFGQKPLHPQKFACTYTYGLRFWMSGISL